MSEQTEMGDDRSTETDSKRYPFGLSSQQLFVLVALVGIIGPGLGVYIFEQANLPLVADLVWIVGYGTAVLVVWFIWLRPLDLVGSRDQDVFTADDTESSPNEDDNRTGDQSGSTESTNSGSTSENPEDQ
ncbi:hypothetical protein SAMN04488065_2674 [Haloplanus vescus]|jgi:hypothetical protein|uniref:Uncharacterized protein n=1 Tax=Haloplanus vescus TaxID=555874 RepID=A0A1H4A8X7_9EURY|nr:hypothetical protein [Haloplanus vescus]SEA32573.1 hypothetical protein SAMN04488065_2674 [Haloplanus vescus]